MVGICANRAKHLRERQDVFVEEAAVIEVQGRQDEQQDRQAAEAVEIVDAFVPIRPAQTQSEEYSEVPSRSEEGQAATGRGGGWRVEVLRDELTDERKGQACDCHTLQTL